jgi:hypothetical protein
MRELGQLPRRKSQQHVLVPQSLPQLLVLQPNPLR